MPSAFRERLEERREQMSEHMRERMERMQGRSHEAHERHERARILGNEIAEQLRNGNPRPEELKKQLEELKSLREDRRQDQRAFLRQRWGGAVHKPDVKDELERHARRLARLQRLEIVAATERTGEPRKKFIARIEQMRTQENERHEKAMKRLVPEAANPSEAAAASAAPAAASAPAVAVPAASGGSL
jgi:hypothetical protein